MIDKADKSKVIRSKNAIGAKKSAKKAVVRIRRRRSRMIEDESMINKAIVRIRRRRSRKVEKDES